MICPHCGADVPGLGYYCHECKAYTTDPGAKKSPPWSFTLALPPNLANTRMHWTVKSRGKREYIEGCDRRYPIGPATTLPTAKASVTLYVHQPMDEDNAVARVKWPIDWFVTRGYVADDSPDCLSLEVRQELDRKAQRIEITLEAA